MGPRAGASLAGAATLFGLPHASKNLGAFRENIHDFVMEEQRRGRWPFGSQVAIHARKSFVFTGSLISYLQQWPEILVTRPPPPTDGGLSVGDVKISIRVG